jgi:hypothetical protein
MINQDGNFALETIKGLTGMTAFCGDLACFVIGHINVMCIR